MDSQEHALPKNGSRGGPLLWDLGGKGIKFSSIFFIRIIHVFLQVSSSVEGPGGVTAEAIFDRVEQIAWSVGFLESLYLWRFLRGFWRAYTSEDQLVMPAENSWYGELIVSFFTCNCIRLQSILSIYNHCCRYIQLYVNHCCRYIQLYIQPHFTTAPMFTTAAIH